MLNGKTALITGGTSGIGLATAKLMHSNGAQVVITGRDASKPDVAEEIGKDVLALQVDVLSRTSLATMASRIKEAFGGLNVFFADAGVAIRSRLGALGVRIKSLRRCSFWQVTPRVIWWGPNWWSMAA